MTYMGVTSPLYRLRNAVGGLLRISAVITVC